MEDQKPELSKQVIMQQSMSEENFGVYLPAERLRSRPLGLLETMYHTFNCRVIDICPLFFRISCKLPVTRQQIKTSLFKIAEEFPSLRLTIVQTGQNSYKFVEKEHIPITIKEMYITSTPTLSQECLHRFDFSRGPLWKFTWLKSPNSVLDSAERPFSFEFFFTFHHAIGDFYLSRAYVQTFLCNILHSQGILPERIPKYRDLYPSIETVIPLHLVSQKSRFKERNFFPVYALDIYNAAFSSEIHSLKERGTTGINTVKFQEDDSKSFFQQCKQQNVKVTSAINAAIVLSFTQLVRKAIPKTLATFVVPTEVVVDLRHFVVDERTKDSFGSVGAVHMPLLVDIDLLEDIESKSYYWSVANQCQNKLKEALASGEPMRVLREDVPFEIKSPPRPGKSRFVLTLSNLAFLNDITPEDHANMMKLEEFTPWSNVDVDDMPIFYVGVYTLNNCLNLAVGHGGSYTSEQTAAQFKWQVTKLLKCCSKL